MNMKRNMMLVLLGMALVLPLWASAQDQPADNMQFVIEKIQADKKLFVAANMQLTEAEANAFWPIYEEYQQELFLLRSRTLKLIGDYADAYEQMTDATAKKLLDELITIEMLGPKLRETFVPRFRIALPDVKVVRYYQLENKIHAALMYKLAGNIPLVK